MYEYVQRPRRTILEVLLDFRHAKVPKEYIFDLFPLMRPREFSIASSIKVRSAPVRRCNHLSHPRRTEAPQVDSAMYSDRQVQNQAQACSKRSLHYMARRARAVYGQESPSRNTQGATQSTSNTGDACSLHRARHWHCADEVYDPRENC